MKEEIEKQLQDLGSQQLALRQILVTQINSNKLSSALATIGDLLSAQSETKMLSAVKSELDKQEKKSEAPAQS